MLRPSLTALLAAIALASCSQSEPSRPLAAAKPLQVAHGGGHHDETKAPSSQPAKKGKGEKPADRNQKDEDGVVRRGDEMTANKPFTVDECVQQASELDGRRVKIEGTVDQVCAKKGCWFVVKGDAGDASVRITSKGYRFFVPRDAKGKRAVVEGELTVKVLSEADAKHLAEDSGQDPSKAKGDKTELQLAAVGLELREPPRKR